VTITLILLHIGRPLWREDGSAVCSAITQWYGLRRTHNHIYLSRLRLLQPGGPGSRICIPQEQGSKKNIDNGQLLLTVTDKRQPTSRQRGRPTKTTQRNSDRINIWLLKKLKKYGVGVSNSGQSKSWSYILTDGASSFWCRAPSGIGDQILISLSDNCFHHIGRPLWREDGSAVCSAITQWYGSRRTHNHISLSHLRPPTWRTRFPY
jgi:hypothetical protein